MVIKEIQIESMDFDEMQTLMLIQQNEMQLITESLNSMDAIFKNMESRLAVLQNHIGE